jgi:hypothetical protein
MAAVLVTRSPRQSTPEWGIAHPLVGAYRRVSNGLTPGFVQNGWRLWDRPPHFLEVRQRPLLPGPDPAQYPERLYYPCRVPHLISPQLHHFVQDLVNDVIRQSSEIEHFIGAFSPDTNPLSM